MLLGTRHSIQSTLYTHTHTHTHTSLSIALLLFNHSVLSNSVRPHVQHARVPCPSRTPGVCSNSCPLSWWCHPTISSSVVPVSTCLQSFPASGSPPVSWLFARPRDSPGKILEWVAISFSRMLLYWGKTDLQ